MHSSGKVNRQHLEMFPLIMSLRLFDISEFMNVCNDVAFLFAGIGQQCCFSHGAD